MTDSAGPSQALGAGTVRSRNAGGGDHSVTWGTQSSLFKWHHHDLGFRLWPSPDSLHNGSLVGD